MSALMTIESVVERWPVLSPDSAQESLIRANLAGDEVGVGDLDRIKVPSGGGLTWNVPALEGERQEKALEGIILHVARRRAFWRDPQPKGTQPDCSSADCVTGHGDPGGPCASCPMNEFGSAIRQGGGQGRGKACKEVALLFLLRPGQNLPEIVSVPPGSLKAVKQYRLKLQVPYFAAITRLELERKSNKDGISFAQIKPTYVGAIPAEAAAEVKKFADALVGVFASAGIDRSEVDGGGDE